MRRPLVPILLGLSLLLAAPARADVAPDPKLPIPELELHLKPLRKAELEKTAEAWVGALQDLTRGTSEKQIAIRSAEGDAKAALLDELAGLREERAALMERVRTVIAELGKKGGDTAELDQYVHAVGGVKVDVTDAQSVLGLVTSWLTSPEGGIRVGKNVLFFLLLLVAFRFLAGLVGKLVRRGLDRFAKTPELLRNFLSGAARNLVFFIGLVVALGQLGVDIGPLLAAIGGAGFVLGFALQGVLGNFAAGVMILLYRPYELGDVVTVAGVTGKVSAMTLVSTTVLTPDNQVIIVPNSSIWGDVVTNVTGSDTRRVDMVFGIGYDDDLAKAQQILEGILADHPQVLEEPAPTVGVAQLADSSVNFNVRPWVATPEYFAVLGDVTRQVKERFDAEGISIPYPQTDIHLHQVPSAG